MLQVRKKSPGSLSGKSFEKRDSAWQKVYALVNRIPAGSVMTYGQVALYVRPLTPRAVGWAMNNAPEGVPWHRVVNAQGGCSTDRLPHIPTGLQRSLLERERVLFRKDGTLDLKEYRWTPDLSDPQSVIRNP